MQSIHFTCELITPLFMSGADGTTPELRAPSIKGALRFWWRAMNGHLTIEELKKQEGQIFGDTSQRSRIIIKGIELTSPKIVKRSPLPHRERGFMKEAFDTRQFFTLKIGFIDNAVFTIEQVKSLVYLTFTLGGLGNRSRRGFGSVKLSGTDKPTISVILKHLKTVNPKGIFEENTEGGISARYNRENAYPFIKEIEIGRPDNDLLRIIGDATHFVMRDNPYPYKASIGMGAGDRFSSPIYVSVVQQNKDNLPIITTLNTVPPQNGQKNYSRDISLSLQKEFKRQIL
ncbi:MAG: type III-B CRISPR module RAMP protein Cmr1 [Saprospiraceae bacterium]|nr:type III-B CRISPR module RAMP protein Cmr1 [Saprospiraceae bacterium]